jgi:hypothetical protein
VSLPDELLQGGVVVGEGGFSLDRRRAMDKLAHYQLEDPFRYVVELVAAAVRAGAERIDIREDADDFVITWEGGLHPTREELDALFDHLFRDLDEDRVRMLQHLAQGVHGALGIDPDWVKLERPGLTLDLTDPLEVGEAPNDRAAGVRVHVRERLTWKVISEALRPFRAGYETQLLRADAHLCPVPLTINGRPVPRAVEGAPEGAPRRSFDGGQLWLAEVGPGQAPPKLQVVRDGVVVERRAFRLADLYFGGWIAADGIRLDAARAHVVEDERWAALRRRVLAQGVALVADGCRVRAELSPGEPLPAAWRSAGLASLGFIDEFEEVAPLVALPLFEDINEEHFSLEALRAWPEVGVVDEEAGGEVMAEAAASGQRLFAGEQRRTLKRLLGARAVDRTETLALRIKGRQRREELARQARPLRFDTAAGLDFEEGQIRGFAGVPGERDRFIDMDASDGLHIELRVDGLPVSTLRLEQPGPIYVRVEHPRLKALPGFDGVVRDGAFSEATQASMRAASRLRRELCADGGAAHPEARRVLLNWLASLGKGRPEGAKLTALPAELRDAPLFPDLGGRRLSPAQLAERLEAQESALYFLAPDEEPPVPAPEVLSLDEGSLAALREWLRDRGRVTSALPMLLRRAEAEAERLERLKPLGTLEAMAACEGPGWTGFVGLLKGRLRESCRVQVFSGGRKVLGGWVKAPGLLPGASVSVEWPGAPLTPDGEALADPDGACRWLGEQLRGPLQALVLDHLRAAIISDLPLWLEAAFLTMDPLPEALRRLPIFTLVGSASLSDLQHLQARFPHRRLHYQPIDGWPWMVSTGAERGEVEGFAATAQDREWPVMYLDPPRLRILDRFLPLGWLLLDDNRAPPSIPAPRLEMALRGRREVSGPGWKGEIGLMRESNQKGTYVAVRRGGVQLLSGTLTIPGLPDGGAATVAFAASGSVDLSALGKQLVPHFAALLAEVGPAPAPAKAAYRFPPVFAPVADEPDASDEIGAPADPYDALEAALEEKLVLLSAGLEGRQGWISEARRRLREGSSEPRREAALWLLAWQLLEPLAGEHAPELCARLGERLAEALE